MSMLGFLLLNALLGPASLASGGEKAEEHPLSASVTVRREEGMPGKVE